MQPQHMRACGLRRWRFLVMFRRIQRYGVAHNPVTRSAWCRQFAVAQHWVQETKKHFLDAVPWEEDVLLFDQGATTGMEEVGICINWS